MKVKILLPYFFALVPCLQTQHTPQIYLNASFDELVDKLLEEFHVPGVSLAVIDGGNITTKGYGFAKLPHVLATPDTLWYTGSTTKAFTGAAAGVLVQDGKRFPNVKWSTPLSQLLPGDFVLSKDYETAHISLEDALSHRSGISQHDLACGWDNASALEIVRSIRHLPFSAEPRTRWQYCNLMFASVGAAIERSTGKDLEAVLRSLFWQPLGMLSTMFSLNQAVRLKDAEGNGRLARGYHWRGGYYIPEALMDLITVAGAGATISSVNDYALWVKALLEVGCNDSSLITMSLYKDMMKPRSIIDSTEETGAEVPRYSLGWFLSTVGGKPLALHPGTTIGFGSQVYLLPNEKFGFVTMANSDGPGNVVGNMLFLQLLKQRFPAMDHIAAEQSLGQLHGRDLPSPFPNKGASQSSEQASTAKIPLPGNVDDYTGPYTHPGYGVFNVSRKRPWDARRSTYIHMPPVQQVPLQPSDQDDQSIELFVQPSSRMWPGTWSLRHYFLTFFHADMYTKHGMDEGTSDCDNDDIVHNRSLACRNETYYQFRGESRARFEYDGSGKVRWLGMQPDPDFVRLSRDTGGDGMIWFEKM